MKKRLIGIVALLCIAALCVTLLVACDDSKGLAKPSGLQYNSGILSWDAVEGADGYLVRVNEGNEFLVEGTSVTVDDSNVKASLVAGETNTLYVTAVTKNESGEVAAKSKTASYDFDYAEGTTASWKVTFDLNYEGAPEAEVVSVTKGEKVSKPTDPEREGWKFEGWLR